MRMRIVEPTALAASTHNAFHFNISFENGGLQYKTLLTTIGKQDACKIHAIFAPSCNPDGQYGVSGTVIPLRLKAS
jgi:hypothetical protein